MTLWSLVALVCLAAGARADVVVLKNGDRVTGTLVTIKGGTLQIKSDVLGSLSIPMDKVASYTFAKPVALITKGKVPVEGAAELTPSGDWQVNVNGRTQTVKAADVDTVMPADAYQTLVVASPRPWEAWKGTATVGASLQRGNQDTSAYSTTINAVRERAATPIFETHTRANLGIAVLLSHASETGVSGNTITAHTLSGNLREDFLFTPNVFVFGLAQIDHISTEGLYLRQTYGGGFGKDLVKNKHTTFSALGGLTFQHEKFFDGSYEQSADGLVGETLGEQFSKRIRLDHTLTFYPNFSQGGEYRFDTATALSLKINTRLSLNTGVIDLFLSNPPPGNQRNNITFTTGIGYSF